MTIGTCPACGEPHASGEQTCPRCGEPLSQVARVLTGSTARRQPRWLDQNRQRASGLRRSETDASERRMEQLLAADRRRVEADQAVARRTAGRERRALLLAGAALFAMAVVLGILLLTVLL